MTPRGCGDINADLLAHTLQVDDLDFAIRKKSPEKAAAAYAAAKSALNDVLSALG